ncbi:replication factor C subunit 3 [Cyclospora cayetanensis]|uniref:Replication factor C subunit 3 n=1 Tax=Cyclospora cayetanensis TaxID=88456 RepID=A0A6P6RSM2_9EIME|nr:replication factor C subunit 3 [Cyclospora cayetanensis]
MLWVDKHAPRRLGDLDCHKDLTPLLRSLAANDSLPHLLFYGPSGAGKKTRALALLREIFGDEVDKVRVETFVEKESNAEATVCQSSCHVILSCTEFGLRDRVIVQGIIRSLVDAAPQAALASSFFSTAKKQKRFKVVVLQDADLLSEGAQHALRRSLETHVSSLKFLLLASNPTRITGPLKSRCLGIRVPLPPTKEVISVLHKTAITEETPAELIPEDMLQQVTLHSGRNLRRALLSLQCILTQNFAAAAGAVASSQLQQLVMYGHPSCPFPAPWEAVADEIAAKIAKAPSVRTLQECRGCFYELLAALIPADLVLLRIVRSLFFIKPGALPSDSSLILSKTNASVGAAEAASAAAKYQQHRSRRLLLLEVVGDAALAAQGLRRGSKPIFHLEAFAASAMRRFKAFSEAEALKHKP